MVDRLEPRPLVAIFGPTASGKSSIAAALAERVDGEVVSADSAALYEGLAILSAAAPGAAHLVGVIPLEDEVSVGAYQQLAHRVIDDLLHRAKTPVVTGGTGLYLRAAIGEMTLPPPAPAGSRARLESLYDELGADEAHALLQERDPAAAARVHANDRRRVVRALELAELGASLAPAADTLWSDRMRHPTLLVGLELSDRVLEARVRARLRAMVTQGVVAEARAAWSRELSSTARQVIGLEAFATMAPADAQEVTAAATMRLARYQRKWLRRLPVSARLDAERPTGEIVDEIAALAGARERLPDR